MAKLNSTLFFLTFTLCLIFSSCSRVPLDGYNNKMRVRGWCIAQPYAPPQKLQGFLDYACSKYNCTDIQPGGPCFIPNTLRNHGSYALNLNFCATGICQSDIGRLYLEDPSFAGCHYP